MTGRPSAKGNLPSPISFCGLQPIGSKHFLFIFKPLPNRYFYEVIQTDSRLCDLTLQLTQWSRDHCLCVKIHGYPSCSARDIDIECQVYRCLNDVIVAKLLLTQRKSIGHLLFRIISYRRSKIKGSLHLLVTGRCCSAALFVVLWQRGTVGV